MLTQTAPTASDQPADDRLVGVTIPATGPDGPLDGVALVTIQRPDVLNALSFDLLDELADALATLDADPACRAIVLTGSGERAFAAGADIRELARQTPVTLPRREPVRGLGADRGDPQAGDRGRPRLRPRRRLRARDELRPDRRRRGRPVRPARDQPRGDAGGGRHPAADPGDRPGAGDGPDPDRPDDHGPRGRGDGPGQPRRAGGPDPGRGAGARRRRSPPRRPSPSSAAKEAVRLAEELPLGDGLRHERRAFFALFATEDQTEGMAAFVEKRRPEWKGR